MHTLLRSVWDEPRPVLPASRPWRDRIGVGTLLALTVLDGALRLDTPGRWVSVTIVCALLTTLLWRRSRPLLMVAIASSAGLAVEMLTAGGNEPFPVVFLLLLPYSLFRWGSGRAIVVGVAVMLAGLGLGFAVGDSSVADAVGEAAVVGAALALGSTLRYRAKAQVREIDRVKLREREALARDLHDTVAHHVSAMAVRAQAGLAVAQTRPEAAAEALQVIEAEAGRALTEMRAIVRVLRRDEDSDPAASAPVRGIADLRRLAEEPGVPPVELRIHGEATDLAPATAAALYRIAQEGVTNARRHARHARRIEVRVEVGAAAVRLRVSDDGDGGARRQIVAPGYGLTGMAERAHLLGGTCAAGPDPDRDGWTVTALLPRNGEAA